ARIHAYWIRVAVALVLGCWFLLAGAVAVITPPPFFSWCAWEQLLQQMPTPTYSEPTRIYAFEDLVAYHIWFASTKARENKFQVIVIKGIAAVPEDPAFFLPRLFDEFAIQ